MSSITIYQSFTDLNDPKLEQLISECQTIMTRGQNAVVDMCMNIAQQNAYLNTLKKKDKKAKVAMIIATLNIKDVTWRKYAKAGAVYLAEPEKRQLTMEQLRPKPARHLTAVKSTKARSTYAHTINDESQAKASLVDDHQLTKEREADLLRWEAFAHWLSAQMPADQFDKVYNRFCAQYRA